LNGSQTHIITFVRTIQNKVEPLVGDVAASQRKRAASGKTAGQGTKDKRRAAGKGAGAQEAGLPASLDQKLLVAVKCEARQVIAAGSRESQPPEKLARTVETTSPPRGGSVSPTLPRKRRASCWRLFWTTKAGRKRKLKTLRTFSRVKTLRTFSRVCM